MDSENALKDKQSKYWKGNGKQKEKE